MDILNTDPELRNIRLNLSDVVECMGVLIVVNDNDSGFKMHGKIQ